MNLLRSIPDAESQIKEEGREQNTTDKKVYDSQEDRVLAPEVSVKGHSLLDSSPLAGDIIYKQILP